MDIIKGHDDVPSGLIGPVHIHGSIFLHKAGEVQSLRRLN
jgi:hypothetical protein